MGGAADGDRASLDSLLLHFHDPLRQFIAASIAPAKTAGIGHEDIFQETIVAAIRGIRGIEPRGSDAFFSWLKTIAGNCHRNMVEAASARKRGGGRAPVTTRDNADSTATSILKQVAGTDPTSSNLGLVVRFSVDCELYWPGCDKQLGDCRVVVLNSGNDMMK